jgi:regulatory protein
VLITRITKNKGKRTSFAVYLDGEHAFDAPEAVLAEFALGTGRELDERTVQAIKATALQKTAEEIAVNYISYRPRSSREVQNHLLHKGYPKELAESVASRLESVKLVNNLEFARMFVRDRLRRKPTGKALLQKQLSGKGIPSTMIRQVLDENISDEDQTIAAKELATRRLRLTKRSLTKLDTLKQKQRLTGYLLRHGFSTEIVQKTIQTLFRQ